MARRGNVARSVCGIRQSFCRRVENYLVLVGIDDDFIARFWCGDKILQSYYSGRPMPRARIAVCESIRASVASACAWVRSSSPMLKQKVARHDYSICCQWRSSGCARQAPLIGVALRLQCRTAFAQIVVINLRIERGKLIAYDLMATRS